MQNRPYLIALLLVACASFFHFGSRSSTQVAARYHQRSRTGNFYQRSAISNVQSQQRGGHYNTGGTPRPTVQLKAHNAASNRIPNKSASSNSPLG